MDAWQNFLATQNDRQLAWQVNWLQLGHQFATIQGDVEENVSPLIAEFREAGEMPWSTRYNW